MSEPVDLTATAIELGAAGFRVFPRHVVDGKICLINGWPEKASTDPQEIVDMFTGREVVGIAIATGDDWTVIDIDVPGEVHEHDGHASLKAAGVKLPRTLAIPTSSGGEHRFYRTAGGAKKTVAGVTGPNGEKLLGVDMRGRGGLVKVHDAAALIAGRDTAADTSGMPWLPVAGERTKRTAKPAAFLDELRAIERRNWGRNAQPSDEAVAVVEAFRDRSPHIGYDELRDDLTHRLADVVSAGFAGASWAVGAARSIYVDAAPANGEDYGAKFDAALYGLEKLRLPLRALRLSKAEKRALDAAPKREKRKLRSLADLMQRDFPPLGWVVQDVIPEGTSLLVSAPKIGKSLLSLDVAIAAATGRGAFGGAIPTGEPRPVLYLDLESGERRLQSRVRAQGWDEFGGFRYHLDATSAVETLKRFMRKHAGKRPLAILDTLAAVMTDRGDRATLLKHEYDTLKQFQVITASDPGSAVIIVHHTRKLDSTDPLAMASGTHGTTGAVDHVLVLSRPDRMRTDGVLARVSRDVEDVEFELHLRDARWFAAGASAVEAQRAYEKRERERAYANLGPLARGLVQLVEAADEEALSVEAIFKRYGGASDRDTVSKTLARLARTGQIQKVGRGLYGPQIVTTHTTNTKEN